MKKDEDLRKNKIKPLSLDDFHALNKEINQIKISFKKVRRFAYNINKKIEISVSVGRLRNANLT
jgi:hypothetical protein